MDATKLHLILNYYPAFAAIIGTVLLAVGVFRGGEKLKRSSLKLFIIVAVFTLPVFVTGEIAGGSGARNGTYSGATADGLEQHKSFARPAFLMVEACGVAAIFGLLLIGRGSNAVRWVLPLTLVISIAASVAVITTIHLGRQVKWAAMAANFENREIVDPDVSGLSVVYIAACRIALRAGLPDRGGTLELLKPDLAGEGVLSEAQPPPKCFVTPDQASLTALRRGKARIWVFLINNLPIDNQQLGFFNIKNTTEKLLWHA